MRFRFLIAFALVACTAPVAAQQRIDRPGTIPHPTAGAHFPERVGDFRRTGVVQYDAEGRDLSASYVLDGAEGQMVLTVYVHPAARLAATAGADAGESGRAALCRRELAEVGQVIESQPQYRGARRIEDGAAPAVEAIGAGLALRSVHVFTAPFDGREQPVRSETDLYCFVGGEWLVKYRATSNADFDGTRAVETFIRSGPWPGRTPPPAPDEVAEMTDRGRAAPAA